jgi:hypothetical protein
VPGTTGPTTLGSGGAASTVTPVGPAVRAHHFVAKDPFAPQISAPSAASTTGGTSVTPSAPATGSGSTRARTKHTGSTHAGPTVTGFAVALAILPARQTDAASRAVVAAENVGLIGISIIPIHKGKELAVSAGPFADQAAAQVALVRVLRDGYTKASVIPVELSRASL